LRKIDLLPWKTILKSIISSPTNAWTAIRLTNSPGRLAGCHLLVRMLSRDAPQGFDGQDSTGSCDLKDGQGRIIQRD
jgi:hypothetical protein